jgi:hypothetical protein
LLLDDLSTVVLIIAAELDSVETTDFDVAGERLGVLRNIWLLRSIKLQVELFSIGDL